MTVTDLQSRSCILRGELKAWEKAFASAHNGRKASREEIKKDVFIAAKYKEYNRLREILPSASEAAESQQLITPTKPRTKRPLESPNRKIIQAVDVTGTHEVTQSPANLATPAVQRMFVGPTPQKDGVVLGLFDLLPEHVHATPSKAPSTDGQRMILGDLNRNAIPVTPSKAQRNQDDTKEAPSVQKYSRTPQSAGKRFLLDTFITPSKRRRLSTDILTPSHKRFTNPLATPRSIVRELHFPTPSFLRRDSQRLDSVYEAPEADDDNTFASALAASPSAPKQWTAPTMRRRKGMARSLSSMIAEMRAQEEERMDEGMELLREVEEEDEDGVGHVRENKSRPALLVRDSQVINAFGGEEDEHRLGPDGAQEEDTDDAAGLAKEGLGPGGVPLRVWKKKGLKRQTKRVLMRPIVRPATRATTSLGAKNPLDIDLESENIEANEETIIETQLQHDGDDDGPEPSDDEEFRADGSASDSSGDGGDDHNDDDLPAVPKYIPPSHDVATTTAGPSAKDRSKSAAVKESITKAAKKISSTAHTNFRRLKIKSSKGASGGGGGGFRGRFGRRR